LRIPLIIAGDARLAGGWSKSNEENGLKKRTQIAALLVCGQLVCGLAHAQAQKSASQSYALMSLIGDSLSLVNYGGAGATPGSKVEQNVHQDTPVKESTFDTMVLTTAAEAVGRLQPDAPREILSTRNAAMFRLQDQIFVNNDASRAVRNSLKGLLKDYNSTRLIIVTKHRDPVQLPLQSGAYGVGALDGLGFYIDNTVKLADPTTGKVGWGVIGAYVFVNLRLVDAKTLEVIRELPIASTREVPRTGAQKDMTWEKMSDVDKVKFVQGMITEAINDAMPKLLKPAP
jgi:hypothetical protein